MKYRSEIDGLRALAVLPVILFHAGFSGLSGGFLGVDVFFVISGYLITCIILDDVARGTFSIARFYERRARRILPALFCVLLITSIGAWAWMLPSQYDVFARSLIATIFFVPNIFFWRESSYFAADAAQQPLLHTWSLGVEEQFYVLFPIAMIVLWRFGKRPTMLFMLLAGVISFIACEYASRMMPSANFFLLPTRAWELMVGALCAFAHHQHAPRKHNLLAMLGLALILASFFTLGEHIRLPSAYSLAPVLGTALIILFATSDSWVGRALSLRPVVAIGLISYSAYLWHHPIFAFARIRTIHETHTIALLALVAAALLLAALTWYFVEQPFRNKAHRHYVNGRTGLRVAILIALMVIGIGVHGHLTHGRLEAWQAQATAFQRNAFSLMQKEQARRFEYDNGDCRFNLNQLTEADEPRIAACSKTYGKGIAIIGDSHAMNLFHVMRHSLADAPFLVGFAQGMCRPYETLATCNYLPFLKMLERHPSLFEHIMYEQAGWEMLRDMHGRPLAQDMISGLPLDARVPDFTPNRDSINAARDYLVKLTPFARVTWLGPRLEPEITETMVIQRGCDYPFTLRPNQEAVFRGFDSAISDALSSSTIHYRSQIDLIQLDMKNDFMNCEQTYWKDRNHYSEAGEAYFAKRLTREKILP
ncbi:MAG: acyltransferase [Alphaproteobacteria bacterium]|nr:acyltransferase [Alphaproteobacteria bacterium]